ncbi:uncharacterized protein LOC115879427 isoform X2 [Sitophilus oryzae]|uniref:Uncharacterized protein LOC115879427 isoform X2 n=1 Tax=Sitophilus oryzae TaxID=7048 RepID=A0A6J2XLC9_SITOR|nr:uncharacterized protein LOC115879427 isoform X2 [Sitophilus oryzae]
MAFIKWRKCFSSPNQFLKLIIVIGCICFSVYQVVKCVEKLIQPPISTYYGFHLNDTIRYPSVTICRSPSFNTALFPKFGLRRINDLMTYNAFRHFNFVNYTIKDFLEETTWSFDELISSFAYNGLGNPYKNTSVVEFYSITRGRCFTLTPRSTSERFSISGGWWFYLKHNFTIRSLDGYGMSTAGFHIHLHDDNEIMTSETDQENNFLEYIYLEAAEDMRLTLKIQEFKKVSTTDLPCIDNDSRYSKSRCQELCVHRQIAQSLNCTLPWLWMIRENRTRFEQCSNSSSVHALLASFGEKAVSYWFHSSFRENFTFLNKNIF